MRLPPASELDAPKTNYKTGFWLCLPGSVASVARCGVANDASRPAAIADKVSPHEANALALSPTIMAIHAASLTNFGVRLASTGGVGVEHFYPEATPRWPVLK
jgi:hypothetical protein